MMSINIRRPEFLEMVEIVTLRTRTKQVRQKRCAIRKVWYQSRNLSYRKYDTLRDIKVSNTLLSHNNPSVRASL